MAQTVAMASGECDEDAIARLRDLHELRKDFCISEIPMAASTAICLD
jgi:hypothetical protein